MVPNLWFNLLIKKIFSSKNFFFITVAQILLSIVMYIPIVICYSNEDITITADLQKQIDINYNLYLSNMVATNKVAYQTFFQARNINNANSNIWRGVVTALFIDENGNLREDSNANLRLDSTDAVINFIYNSTTNNIQITKRSSNYNIDHRKTETIHKLTPLWSTEKSAPTTTAKLGDKKYNSVNISARFLYTQIINPNNIAETHLLLNNICNNNSAYFNLNLTSCNQLINYLYGKVTKQQRSKTILTAEGDKKIINLGDIVHSELVVVGDPKENYYSVYNDSSYATFQNHYITRRKVLYVGANDGFIHAFNAGFYNSTTAEIQLSGNKSELKHPLGAEIWAYAPMNLLPHLQNLTNPDYQHQFLMDGNIQIIDARIFADDAQHPQGWGTLLLATMGLGGKNINITINNKSKSFRSSYILLDITNPEIAPQVIAEINHQQAGFTLGKPVIIKRKIINDNSNANITHDWYLVFTSGPANNNEQTNTNNNLKIFIYDLQAKKFIQGFNPKTTNFTFTYAGNMQNVDWEHSYEDSCIYFGTLKHQANILLSGSLLRLQLTTPIENSILSTLVTNTSPIMQAPLLVKDHNNFWVFFGSGRLLTTNDYTNTQEQFAYGICEQVDQDGNFSQQNIDESNLIDTTDIEILTTGEIKTITNSNLTPLIIDKNTITNFLQLENAIAKHNGWKFKFSESKLGVLHQQPQRLASLILFSEFKPKNNNIFVGDKYLHLRHYTTGTASTKYQVLPNDKSNQNENETNNILTKTINTGIGYKTNSYITNFNPITKTIDILIPNTDKISISTNNLPNQNKTYQNSRLSWRKIK